jgi:hypothetical protein
MKPTLMFVYNADSGLFNMLGDLAHKIFSPETYPCSLCGLTYSSGGMRKEWKRFLDGLDRPLEFLHRDELRERYRIEDVALPAIFLRNGGDLRVWIDAPSLDVCESLEQLQDLIRRKLPEAGPFHP